MIKFVADDKGDTLLILMTEFNQYKGKMVMMFDFSLSLSHLCVFLIGFVLLD